MDTTDGAFTVLVVGGDDPRVAAALAAALPRATMQRVSADAVSRLPDAAGLIVAERSHARIARAAGFTGGIVVHAAADGAGDAALLAQGTHVADPAGPAGALTNAIAVAIPVSADGQPKPVPADVAHTRRLIAAGELAFTLQHSLNNPLTALLAEVQMMQFEASNDDQKELAARLLELVRRITEISRTLDSVRGRTPIK